MKGWEELFNMSTELSARYHAHVGECWVVNVQNTSDGQTAEILCETEYQEQWFNTGGGWTAIVAPGGSVVAGPLKDEEGILTATIDLENILDMAHWHDAVGHYARPDVVNLSLNRTRYGEMIEPAQDLALMREPTARAPEAAIRSLEKLKEKMVESGESELLELTENLERELQCESGSEATPQ